MKELNSWQTQLGLISQKGKLKPIILLCKSWPLKLLMKDLRMHSGSLCFKRSVKYCTLFSPKKKVRLSFLHADSQTLNEGHPAKVPANRL